MITSNRFVESDQAGEDPFELFSRLKVENETENSLHFIYQSDQVRRPMQAPKFSLRDTQRAYSPGFLHSNIVS